MLIPWKNNSSAIISWVNNSAAVIGWLNATFLQSRVEATILIPHDLRTLTIPGGLALPGFLYFDPKDPTDSATFNFNWGSWINGSDPVQSITSVTTSPSGPTIGTPSLNGNVVSALISGGTAGINYTISCTIVTVNGTIAKRSGILPVQSR